jgi:hypothetical protein
MEGGYTDREHMDHTYSDIRAGRYMHTQTCDHLTYSGYALKRGDEDAITAFFSGSLPCYTLYSLKLFSNTFSIYV